MSRNLAGDFLRISRPPAVVTKLVGSHVAGADPRAGFDRNHLDPGSRNRQRSNSPNGPGANDNATGTAAVLELARLLAGALGAAYLTILLLQLNPQVPLASSTVWR